jgi:hypothetical protein
MGVYVGLGAGREVGRIPSQVAMYSRTSAQPHKDLHVVTISV